MPRKTREDWSGAWHHVMNRGRNREIIFRDDEDALTFMDVVGETCERYEIEVHAYSLMPNHYHLLVRSVNANLSDAMQYFGATYTTRFQMRHGGDGGLFRGRFKSQPILNEAYLIYVLAYIHLNPLKANLITKLDSKYGWTGHRRYMGLDMEPQWLTTSVFLGFYSSASEMEELVLRLHRKAEPWPKGMTEAGWFKWHLCPVDVVTRGDGGEEEGEVTIDELLERVCEICEVEPERLMESVRGPKGNPERRFAVWALRRSTFMTQREIGEALGMTPDHVAHSLRYRGQNLELEGWVERWEEEL